MGIDKIEDVWIKTNPCDLRFIHTTCKKREVSCGNKFSINVIDYVINGECKLQLKLTWIQVNQSSFGDYRIEVKNEKVEKGKLVLTVNLTAAGKFHNVMSLIIS